MQQHAQHSPAPARAPLVPPAGAWGLAALALLAGALTGCGESSLPPSTHPLLDLLLTLALALALVGLVLALRRARTRVHALEDLCTSTEAGRTRARLAGVLRAASRISIISTDTEGVIRVFNTGAEQMLGYTAGEVIGKATPQLIHLPQEIEAYGRELEQRLGHAVTGFEIFVTLARTGGPQGFDAREWTYVRKDGGHVPVDLTVTAIYSDQGELEGYLGMGLDLSARKALEAELRQAQVSMDNAGDMILWARTDDARLVYANQAACSILGYTRQELQAMVVMDINPARTLENWHAHCQALREKGRTTQEMSFRRRDGSRIPAESTSALVEHGGVEYSLGIIRDITLRKAAEESLRRETRLNRSLAEAARALIGPAPDMDALAGLLLDRACELTGSKYGYVAFIDQDSGALHPRAMSAMMQSGECALGALPVTFPLEPDGSYRGLWGHSLNMRQGFYDNNPATHPSSIGLPQGHVPIAQLLTMPAIIKGGLVGQIALANPGRDYVDDDLNTVASLADIFALAAEQIRAQRALLAAKDEAVSSSRAKSDFLANMTHEVRTPLNGILGMLQVLQGTGLTPEQQDYAGVALESAERLNRLLGNVIEFARLDEAGTRAECLLFPPTDLLHSLQAEFEPLAKAKGLGFSMRHSADLPELIRSDPQALRLALVKILDNALKFTPAGNVSLEALCPEGDTSRLSFLVADQGIGIPEDKRQQIFEAFVQADASITRTFGGAGLGLAIARRLAARLGGSLETQDRPEGGTVMILTIPADCPEPTES